MDDASSVDRAQSLVAWIAMPNASERAGPPRPRICLRFLALDQLHR